MVIVRHLCQAWVTYLVFTLHVSKQEEKKKIKLGYSERHLSRFFAITFNIWTSGSFECSDGLGLSNS